MISKRAPLLAQQLRAHLEKAPEGREK